MNKKSSSFPLSDESDGAMGKRSSQKQPTNKKEAKEFFNTTPSSE